MYKAHTLLIALLSFMLASNAGCSKETMKSLSNLSALRSDLMKEYKASEVNVTVQNNVVLGITFINSSFNNLGEEEREKKAREIAFFAKNHYPSIDSIDRIWVSFVASKNYIVFQYSNGLGTYVFDRRTLDSPAPAARPAPGLVITSYNPTSNETTVYLNGNLQLYSDRSSGVMLFPHFILQGDNVSAPKVVIPKSVILDFSTYSEKRMFPDNPRLTVSVDNRPIYSGNARTTNVMGSDGGESVNEFISQEIPYAQFVELTNGTEVKFNLGAKEMKLTRPHLDSLRAMKRCVEELRCE